MEPKRVPLVPVFHFRLVTKLGEITAETALIYGTDEGAMGHYLRPDQP